MIKRFAGPLAFLTALACAVPALAEDWRFVDQDAEAIGVVDADAIDRSGANPKVALTLVFKQKTEGFNVIALNLEFDCAGRRYLPSTVTMIGDDLKPVRTEPTNMAWQPLEPNSRFAFMAGQLCGDEQMPKAPQSDLQAIRDAYLDGKIAT